MVEQMSCCVRNRSPVGLASFEDCWSRREACNQVSSAQCQPPGCAHMRNSKAAHSSMAAVGLVLLYSTFRSNMAWREMGGEKGW